MADDTRWPWANGGSQGNADPGELADALASGITH
jgi:hypothetical protein